MATPRLSPEEQLVKTKLRALAQGVQVWRLEGGETLRYAVPSSNIDGTAYEVVILDAAAGDITCTCPAHIHRGICKHVGAILVRLDVEAEMELAEARAAEDREAQDAGVDDLERKISELYS